MFLNMSVYSFVSYSVTWSLICASKSLNPSAVLTQTQDSTVCLALLGTKAISPLEWEWRLPS